MSTSSDEDKARDAFNALLGNLRPKLHRYCAGMTGSVIDGEDVVQDALADAIGSAPDPVADSQSQRRVGYFASRTPRPSISCASAPGARRLPPKRIRT